MEHFFSADVSQESQDMEKVDKLNRVQPRRLKAFCIRFNALCLRDICTSNSS